MEEEEAEPNVLIFPFPAQGHVNSMLKLAELLSLSGLRVTFLNIHRIHDELIRHTDVEARFSRFTRFRFQTITDGLPTVDNRSLSRFLDLIGSMKSVTKPLLREMLVSGQLGPNVTCIILDGLSNFIFDINAEPKIPLFSFRTISACSFWAYSSVPRLIEYGQLPIKGKEDMDRMIEGVAGMENLLRCRDLPSFSRVEDLACPIFQFVVNQTLETFRAHSVIFNTFDDLEGPILSCLRSLCPNFYVIGPLHAHLKARLSDEKASVGPNSFNSLWRLIETAWRGSMLSLRSLSSTLASEALQ